jgi:cell division septation protein DedD
MKLHSVTVYACVLLLSAALGGCTASSELGSEEPELSAAVRPDTTTFVPPAAAPAVPAPTRKQGFTTREDTIEVESAQGSRRPEHTAVIVQRRTPTPKTSFCVQVGAFRVETNAERAVATLEKRFKHPAVKFFDDAIKLHRVAVGMFATRREAVRFAAAMKNAYPKEYQDAWVIRRQE